MSQKKNNNNNNNAKTPVLNLLEGNTNIPPLTLTPSSFSSNAPSSKLQRTYGVNPNGTPVHRYITNKHRVVGFELQEKGNNGKTWKTIETFSSNAGRNQPSNFKFATPVNTRKRNSKKTLSLTPKKGGKRTRKRSKN
jgi:hypothetical protein